MKTTILLLAIFIAPHSLLSQKIDNSISFMGGGEYYDDETAGWNIELNYERQIQSSRFRSEYGLNYVTSEFTNRYTSPLTSYGCGVPFSPAGETSCTSNQSHSVRQRVHYRKQQSFRLQVGFNYRILDQSNFTLSVGSNFVNQITFNTYEHGQYLFTPIDCNNSAYSEIRSNFSRDSKFRVDHDDLSILIQPHLDLSYRISSKIFVTSRFAYYHEILPDQRSSGGQLNLGVNYRW